MNTDRLKKRAKAARERINGPARKGEKPKQVGKVDQEEEQVEERKQEEHEHEEVIEEI